MEINIVILGLSIIGVYFCIPKKKIFVGDTFRDDLDDNIEFVNGKCTLVDRSVK